MFLVGTCPQTTLVVALPTILLPSGQPNFVSYRPIVGITHVLLNIVYTLSTSTAIYGDLHVIVIPEGVPEGGVIVNRIHVHPK